MSTIISLSCPPSFLHFLVVRSSRANDDMRNGMMCKKTGDLEVKETFFKVDISNQTRTQLVKVSSNDTINRSAGTREATNKTFYLQL